MTRPVTILLALVVAAFLLIAGLQWHYAFENTHNFLRNLDADFATEVNELNTNGDEYYVAGTTGRYFYFAKKAKPLEVLRTDHGLRGSIEMDIDFGAFDETALVDPIIQVDSPFFYVKDETLPRIYIGETSDWKVDSVCNLGLHFTQALPIDQRAIFIQGIFENTQTNEHQNIIGKVNISTTGNPEVLLNPALLKSDSSGFTGSTGVMRYCKSLNRLIFVYFYHGRVVEVDTSLQSMANWQTLDTTPGDDATQVSVSGNAVKQKARRILVNYDFQLDNGFLFVHSALRGKDDDGASVFQDPSAIDVYDLATKGYLLSFHLPRESGERIRSFRILEDKIVATYPGMIKTYAINADHLDKL